MLAQKKTIKVLMFLLPAVVSLLAYTAFHEMLFRKPPCLINCDQPSMFSDNEKIKKWLAYLESLRDDTFNTKSNNKRTFPTPLDIAFLQDKINLASNDRDYLTRYQQIISDLTSASVVKDAEAAEKGNGMPDKVSQLAYLTEDKDPNNQVFANSPVDENADTAPFAEPRTGPYYVPATGSGPVFFAGGGSPNNNGGSPGGEGGNNGGPNVSIPGGGSTNGPGGSGTPIIGGGGNPISSVPVPGSAYLIAGLLIAISLVRLKIVKRKESFHQH